jgi:dimethylhistidine N-methyltransferase
MQQEDRAGLGGPWHSPAAAKDRFLTEVLHGLRMPEKELPCKYFYDAAGSQLFEQICELDEYYLTRTELGIMERHAEEMAAAIGSGCLLVEYGPGAGLKTRLLVDRLVSPAGYIPIDLSPEYLQSATSEIAAGYPELEVRPLCADFESDYQLPSLRRRAAKRVIYFPGSTIGNFGPDEASVLLTRVANVCGPGGGLLLGFDLQKDVQTLEAAYNDAKGVTRDFNLNLLARINRELGADFQIDAFHHRAGYNDRLHCIEMFLMSRRPQAVQIDGEQISFAEHEKIRTERSYKYNLEHFCRWVRALGLSVQKVWTDEKKFFAVLYLTVVTSLTPSRQTSGRAQG